MRWWMQGRLSQVNMAILGVVIAADVAVVVILASLVFVTALTLYRDLLLLLAGFFLGFNALGVDELLVRPGERMAALRMEEKVILVFSGPVLVPILQLYRLGVRISTYFVSPDAQDFSDAQE